MEVTKVVRLGIFYIDPFIVPLLAGAVRLGCHNEEAESEQVNRFRKLVSQIVDTHIPPDLDFTPSC